MAGLHRKFTNPNNLSSASSPIVPPGIDPVAREDVVNRNTARDTRFVFACKKIPHVEYFTRGGRIPGLSLGAATQATPLVDVPHPGDKLVFNPFMVRVAADERWQNYLEIQRWMRGMGKPEAHLENEALRQAWLRETCDASISLMTNGGSFEQVRFEFQHVWPEWIEDIDLDAASPDNEIIFRVGFRYSVYRLYEFPEGFPGDTPGI